MPSLTHQLRHANRRLGVWLEGLALESRSAVATPEQLTAMLSDLLRAGAALRAETIPVIGTDPELDCELARYRRHVERLRELLPSIHSRLLGERARLEGQRARVQAAAEWARASRQIL